MKQFKIPLFFMISLFILSCTTTKKENQLIIFPSPPDTTRIQFLTTFSSSNQILGGRTGFEKFILGEKQNFSIGKPYGIVTSKDKIYICDTQLGGIEIVNLKENDYKLLKPSGFGEFRKPLNCNVDSDGNIYVVDIDRKDIVVFNSNLEFKKSFGSEILEKPTDIAINGTNIYVSDMKKNKIFVFDKNDYNLKKSFPEVSESDSAFIHQATNINIRNNKIYVSDFGAFIIKKYDLDGKYLGSIGSYGNQLGQFVRPKGIATDNDENLYVVDAAFENVQIFSPNEKLLMFFGGSYKGPGYLYLPAKVCIDYENTKYFEKYLYPDFDLKYLIYVTNQYGPDKIVVYGFVTQKSKK